MGENGDSVKPRKVGFLTEVKGLVGLKIPINYQLLIINY